MLMVPCGNIDGTKAGSIAPQTGYEQLQSPTDILGPLSTNRHCDGAIIPDRRRRVRLINIDGGFRGKVFAM
jgi:hypothetical protein